MSTALETTAPDDFISAVKPIWCAGCGDFYVLAALAASLAGQGLRTHEVAVVTGIGCSSRLPGYMACYGFNSIHGRPIPIATGLKLARPDLTVVAAAGDGDAFSIGGGHLIHGARRNVDLTYIVMDNGIYGLTKGQASPTTPVGAVTKTSEGGASELPVNPLELMLTFGASFVAQAYSADQRGMQALFTAAMQHRGFAFVNVISPCPTFRGGMGIYKDLRKLLKPVGPAPSPGNQEGQTPPPGGETGVGAGPTNGQARSPVPPGEFAHNPADYDAAMRIARDSSALYTGVLYAVGGGLAPPRSQSEGLAEQSSHGVPDSQRLSGGRVQDPPLREHVPPVPSVAELAEQYR